MLVKTQGIVLRFVKYGETSIIVTIYTKDAGRSTYIVNGARSSRARGKIALYQPLSLLDMVVYQKQGRDINRISEVKSLENLNSLRTNVYKSSIGLFLVEVLNKCIQEESANEQLFEYILESIKLLDRLEEDFENFHLVFLLKLSQHLGFAAENAAGFYGDNTMLSRPETIEHRTVLDKLIQQGFKAKVKVSSEFRMELLAHILSYYSEHIGLPKMKSMDILHTVLKDS
jgi:DNA repair protein RecO (recombination protein O)